MAKAKHTIRIISGTHRSRRLPVLDFEGLRPTGDRVRETVFNWLQFDIAGKNVLDLCAGSGALGFEASSRGAKSTVMVEKNLQVANQLQAINKDYTFNNTTIINTSAQNYLQNSNEKFDVVFLDPPFDLNLIQVLSELTVSKVNIGGYIYREFAIGDELANLDENWQLFRQKTIGKVRIELWKKISDNEESV